MTNEELYRLLRSATEEDVERVLPRLLESGTSIQGPHLDLLDFYNRMLDELLGERAAWEEIDDQNVADTAERRRKQH